jgi:hypothetical protein
MTNVFVSHKHADHTIARVVAQFITDKGRGDVKVHLSSDAGFEGPRFGPDLNRQLRETLWETDALILVYTAEDQDWSYCMLECGLAQHPQSPDTNIIVFQCSDDVPKPFAADLRVNARNLEDIKRFTNQFMTHPRFFPRRGAALAPNIHPTTLASDAKELYDKLSEVLPKDPEGRRVQQWPAWPYLRVEVPIPEIDQLKNVGEVERKQRAREVIREYGVVVEGDARVAELFGLTDLAPRHMFNELLRTWSEKFPAANPTWFDSCCEQIMIGAQRQFPLIRWAPLRQVGGESDFTPVLSRTRRLSFAEVMQFDIYFYNLSDPQAVPVASRMLRAGEFFCRSLGQVGPESVMLRDLVTELTKLGRNRLPMVSAEGHPLLIIHRSMIEQFIVNHALFATDMKSPSELTLADLLADPKMKAMFESTFCVVSKEATLADAKSSMVATPNCLDVFVTAGGGRNEPMLGWLTNVDIVRSS